MSTQRRLCICIPFKKESICFCYGGKETDGYIVKQALNQMRILLIIIVVINMFYKK
ncbi:hypothetical protein BN4901_2438 [Citrobacter europaeus]|uniref:Uncharacterized protein n=1 Tax=Citrobacter europaeus TaxID=1914243 RepID=A0ABY0JPJ8_9ENTR|nr:hypothetical protein CIP106467_2731 [Citrobacter europaeus]SBW25398.1 hypothetical protein BN4901_2438 [Citrobacter europaeus]